MAKSKQTQQAIEKQLGKFEFPADEQEAVYQEVYGPMSDWILELGDQKLLLDPILKEWFYFEHLHQQWAKTGFGPGQVEFVAFENKLGVKRISVGPPAAPHQEPTFSLRIESSDFPDPLPVTDMLNIGRSKKNEVVLKDVQASRIHARITWDGTTLMIEDLATTNGTMVNGDKILKPTALKPGDEIVVGDTRMQVIIIEEDSRG